MASATDTKNSLSLPADNNLAVAAVAVVARLAALVLLLVGGIGLVGGVAVLFLGAGFLTAAWFIVLGVFGALMGLVTVAVAADFAYLAEVPAFSKVHLKNAVEDLKVYFKILTTLGVFLAVVFGLRLLF